VTEPLPLASDDSRNRRESAPAPSQGLNELHGCRHPPRQDAIAVLSAFNAAVCAIMTSRYVAMPRGTIEGQG